MISLTCTIHNWKQAFITEILLRIDSKAEAGFNPHNHDAEGIPMTASDGRKIPVRFVLLEGGDPRSLTLQMLMEFPGEYGRYIYHLAPDRPRPDTVYLECGEVDPMPVIDRASTALNILLGYKDMSVLPEGETVALSRPMGSPW